MSEQQTSQPTGGERVVYERCLCREVMDRLRECLGVSPAVQQHLTNSRIELLKAVREAIDQRIQNLSSRGQQGTKIAVD